jgi:hypothetical protein
MLEYGVRRRVLAAVRELLHVAVFVGDQVGEPLGQISLEQGGRAAGCSIY